MPVRNGDTLSFTAAVCYLEDATDIADITQGTTNAAAKN
jgi:hypothetical protein